MAKAVNTDPVWATVSVIAGERGVSVPAISKMVKRLIDQHGLEVKRAANGNVALVNRVHFDRLRGDVGDSAMQRPPRVTADEPSSAPGEHTLDGARHRAILLGNEQRRLALCEEARLLVRRDEMSAALGRMAEQLGRVVDLSQHADAISAAYSKAGLHGLRIELKRLTHSIRTEMANVCSVLQTAAPETDDLIRDGSTG
jgi:hypothetical protein